MLTRLVPRAVRIYTRSYGTGTSTTPPMLLKIRTDLKTAMRTKDIHRLTVLRTLLSQTLNASKTPSPISTDAQMLSLLRKNTSASKSASAEFLAAGRQDLADKENAQIEIMEEYTNSVAVVGAEEIRRTVGAVLKGLRTKGDGMKMGDVLRNVFAGEAEGGFGDRIVNKAEVAKVVKTMLEEKC